MHNEDRELQIELVSLQIEHEYLTSIFMGVLAMTFGGIIGLASIFYGLHGKPVFFLIPVGVIVTMFVLVVAMYFAMWRYERRREKLKKRIKELGKDTCGNARAYWRTQRVGFKAPWEFTN